MNKTAHILGRYQAMIDVCREYYQKKCDLNEVTRKFDKLKEEQI